MRPEMSERRDDPWNARGPARGSRAPARPFATALWLGASTAILMFAILTLASTWWRSQRESGPTPLPPSAPPAEVTVWVGDLAPGVLGVLSTESDDPAVDARYDASVNEALGLAAKEGLAYYRLRVFNRGASPVSVRLEDGAIVVTPKGEAPLPMRSLASLLAGEGGREAPSSPSAETLRRLGAGRTVLELPPSAFAAHPVAFARRVDLGAVQPVARADGTPFHLRRMPQRQWAGLVDSPSLDELKDL